MFDYANLRKTIDDTFSKRLFFIMGTIKSGTTWLQLVLHGHPEIACRGEGQFTTFLASNLAKAVHRYNELIEGKPDPREVFWPAATSLQLCLAGGDQGQGRRQCPNRFDL